MPDDTHPRDRDDHQDEQSRSQSSDEQPFSGIETEIGDRDQNQRQDQDPIPDTSGASSPASSTENDDSAVARLREMHAESDGAVEDSIGIPDHLRGKHPMDITLDDLDHPEISKEAREEAINTLTHLQEELEARHEGEDDTTADGAEGQPRTHHELETDHEEVNLNTVLRVVTGRSDRTPTVEQVRDAYRNDEISEAEMEAVLPEAIRGENQPVTDETAESNPAPSESATASHQSSTGAHEPMTDADESSLESEPTLESTDLLNDDGEFPWEEEEVISDASKVGERDVLKFGYKGVPFDVWEPEDKQQYEDKLGLLENFQDLDSGKQEAQARRFARELADDLLEIDGHPHQAVYQVEHPDRGNLVIADEDGSKGLASHPNATPIWDAMSWYDRMMIGQRMGQFVHGDAKFRQRRR
ncbi:hypothetical protein [Halalkalicoccus jeotgali]|uniref:hypothetical protein n=1 Tax=Halalkalicoccus jeotgali TaxID=413810 RepID=UPI0006777545|nr:hypothetical protein [Halalkalicoccus jeotgali]